MQRASANSHLHRVLILLHVQLLADERSIERWHFWLIALWQEHVETVSVLVECHVLSNELVEQQVRVAERGARSRLIRLIQRAEDLAANARLHLAERAFGGQCLQEG